MLPSIQLPPIFRPTMIPEYLPSAMVTADPIFSDPKKRPEAPRPEVDLQCINPAGLSCIHERNRAAPAASPTYKSEDTPPLASATRKSQHHHYSTTTDHHAATTKNDHENHGRLWWRFPRMVATASAGCGGALEAVLIFLPAVDAAGNGLDDSLRRPGGLELRVCPSRVALSIAIRLRHLPGGNPPVVRRHSGSRTAVDRRSIRPFPSTSLWVACPCLNKSKECGECRER